MERLQVLDSIEKDVITCLQSAGNNKATIITNFF